MTKIDAFDLADLDTVAACNKPFKLDIRHPVTRAKVGIWLWIVGRDSDAYDGRIRAIASEQMANRDSDPVTLDVAEERAISILMAATTGWGCDDLGEGKIKHNGEPLDFTPANLRKVYQGFKVLRDQASVAINDLGNFMPV